MPRTAPFLPSEDPVDPDERPSKTQRKKESHELQDLGGALVALPESRVKDLAIPENLRDAVHEYRRTRTHEGKRRQMQYIGKLMRGTDTEPIRQILRLDHALSQDASPVLHVSILSNRLLKKSASGVLAPHSGSPYGTSTIRRFARCGLAGRPFGTACR